MDVTEHIETNNNESESESIINKTSEKEVLSKRQQKLLEKRKRWLEQKPLRKAKEKEKRKLKIQRAREAGLSLGPSRKMLKSSKMADSPCKLKICFDMSLTELMTPSEFSKTFKQLHRCYSINRRASAPLQLYIAGYNDEAKNVMSKMSGCFNWDVNFNQQVYNDLFDKSNIIYLTSDSPNVLENLDYDKVYVIGALVDHNRLKNICYERAVKADVGHARLPLDSYFKFKTRKVLTIDQVYSIFLRVTEGRTWIEAVMDIVPKRKGIELKNDSENNSNCEESEELCDEKVTSSESSSCVLNDSSLSDNCVEN